MRTLRKLILLCLFSTLMIVSIAQTTLAQTNFNSENNPQVKAFINSMVRRYHFNANTLTQQFKQTHVSETVLKKIKKPFESKNWRYYRKHFLTQQRISRGVTFWKQHQKELARAEKQYNIPIPVIVAILGVETKYGKHQGKIPVMDALATLAFNYPPRSQLFRKELAEYLLLAREQGWNPLSIQGSYAGCIGYPQFLPSSYREFGIDFNKNGKIDLINNASDAIGSVAFYLKENGWKPNQPVTVAARIKGNGYKTLQMNKLEPTYTLTKLKQLGVTPRQRVKLDQHLKANLLDYPSDPSHRYWLAFHNFYVIYTYNHNVKYVMAVYQLGQAIEKKRNLQLLNALNKIK